MRAVVVQSVQREQKINTFQNIQHVTNRNSIRNVIAQYITDWRGFSGSPPALGMFSPLFLEPLKYI